MSKRPAAVIDEALQARRGERVTAVAQLLEPDVATNVGPAVVEQLQDNASRTQRAVVEFARQNGGVRVKSRFWITNAVVLDVDTAKMPLSTLARVPEIERVHENVEMVPLDGESGGATTLSHGDQTYGLEQIDVPQVWEQFGTQGEGARIAVLDTGVDPDHPDLDLAPGGWAEFDQDGNRVDSEPYDSDRHGTHVSGTVAGGDTSGEHVGVAPGVELYHGGVLTDEGGTFSAIVGGIEWAVEQDADVINMSLGPKDGGYILPIITPLQNATAAGTFPVSACGNAGEGTSGSPANVYGAGLAIGATDVSESVANFSSGEKIVTDEDWGTDAPEDWPTEYVVPDVAAPGAAVKSTVPGGGYDQLSGTSMASPHVAGVAALIVAASSGGATPAQLREALQTTARKPDDWDESSAAAVIDGKDSRYGTGIVDAPAAVEYVLDAAETTVAATATYEAGQVTLSLDCTAVSEIVVDGVWGDWDVAAVDLQDAFTEQIGTESRCSWGWADSTKSVAPSLTLDVPTDIYVGGTFELTITGSAPDNADEATVTVDLG